MIEINLDYVQKFVSKQAYEEINDQLLVIDQQVKEQKQIHNEYLGWLQHKETADMVSEIEAQVDLCLAFKPDVLVVIGVGGSYLGTRAIDEALSSHFPGDEALEIVYAGLNMSGSYLHDLLAYIRNKNVIVNVISKSGSTIETAVSFRIIKEFMTETYKEEANERIVVTTDQLEGPLKEIADKHNYTTFVIPDDIGGRFSVLTPVGLFPLAMRGHDIRSLLAGEAVAKEDLAERDNPAYTYAIIRNYLMDQGYQIELLASFEPALKYFHEWWKQLFGESEGKEGKGLFPASVSYTTDLHSIGQYVQDGQRSLFETMIHFEKLSRDTRIPKSKTDVDRLNYLTSKSLNDINMLSVQGTMKAHYEGNVPVVQLVLPKLDAYHIGYLVHFFMKACMMSAYLLGVNPFDQPGVETYKRETIQLLKK